MAKNKKASLTKTDDKEFMDKAFILMLYIPLNVLVSDYWDDEKGKALIPEFIDTCLSLYESVQAGVVSFEDMIKYVEKYAGVTINK